MKMPFRIMEVQTVYLFKKLLRKISDVINE